MTSEEDIPAPGLGVTDDVDVETAEWEGGSPDVARDSRHNVWLTYEGRRIVDARLNTNWVQRLGSAARLEAAFQEAFAAGMLLLADPGEATVLEGIDFHHLPEFSPEVLEAYLKMMDDHERRWQEAIDEAAQQGPTPEPLVEGRAKGVVVTLNPGGMPARVQFDPIWLAGAQPGIIAAHVVQAAAKAQARYAPQTHPATEELEEYELRHLVMLEGLRVLIAGER